MIQPRWGRPTCRPTMLKMPPLSTTKSRVIPKLHSIGTLLRGRQFEGAFELSGNRYTFVYAPTKAAVVGGQLQLTGKLTIADARPNARVRPGSQAGVRATLLSIQSGIGAAPPRKKLPPEVYSPLPGVPAVDSSGSQSFAGVLFFHLEPLPAAAFAVNADLSNLQLNARVFPESNLERALQAAYSQASDAMLGKQVDRASAAEAVNDLNRLLAG